MSPRSDESTIRFYDDHADEYVSGTVNVDMESLYQPFLEAVPEGGKILDAGCGSGRDAKAFLDRGYQVTTIDASLRMVEAATELTGQPAKLLRFQEVDAADEFNGIWACASLLHIPLSELDDVLRRFSTALRAGGVFYASFKEGDGERICGGRLFTDFTEASLREKLRQVPALEVLRIWTTTDLRPGRSAERWANALVRKA